MLPGIVTTWSSALWGLPGSTNVPSFTFFTKILMMLFGIFCLQALNPVGSDKEVTGLQTAQMRSEDPLDREVDRAKFMKSTVASRMRNQQSQQSHSLSQNTVAHAASTLACLKTGAIGEGRSEKESAKTKDLSRPKSEADGKDQRERQQTDSHRSEKMCHYAEKQRGRNSSSNLRVSSGKSRLLEFFQAGGRLLRQFYSRISRLRKDLNSLISRSPDRNQISNPCEVKGLHDAHGSSRRFGEAAQREPQKSCHQDSVALPTNSLKSLQALSQKQKMTVSMRHTVDRNTSHEKPPLKQQHNSISCHSSEDCPERGFGRSVRADHATKFSVRPVFDCTNTCAHSMFESKMKSGSADLDDAQTRGTQKDHVHGR